MTLIDPNIDLFALAAEDYRHYVKGSASFAEFKERVGLGGHTFFGGFVHTFGGRLVIQDDDGAVVGEYPLQEVYRYLTTPRLPLA